MAKKAYVGVNGIARNVSNIYVGVGGVARKVVKGYIGVNGVAQQFWDGGGALQIGSWDYWTTIEGTKIIKIINNGTSIIVRKNNNKIAYYAIIKTQNYQGLECYSWILISPNSDAVAYSADGMSWTANPDTIVDANGITWYISGLNLVYIANRVTLDADNINKVLNDTAYAFNDYITPAQDLIKRIYAVPFHEDYATGIPYTLNITDVRKTVRKAVGIYLFLNVSNYSSNIAYQTLSDQSDSIINTILTNHGSNNKLFGINIFVSGGLKIGVISCDETDGNLTRTLSYKRVQNGFTLYNLDACPVPSDAPSINRQGIQISNSGTISSMTSGINPRLVGIQSMNGSSLVANWGIDL